MPRSIYKYRLPDPGATIPLPSHILPKHVAMQDGGPTLWAEVNLDGPWSHSNFMTVHCIGTGWNAPEGGEYLGTLQDQGGFVWHYYAVKPA